MKTKTSLQPTLLLFLLAVGESKESEVTAVSGQDAVLPCRYDTSTYGLVHVCWAHGHLPSSGCGDQILTTDGEKVQKHTRTSPRYELRGSIRDGDVSLTIVGVRPQDRGLYSCRVQIVGWFNDQKHTVRLTVNTASPTSPSSASDANTSSLPLMTETSTKTHMHSQVIPTETLLTSSVNSIKAVGGSDGMLITAYVALGLLVLATGGFVAVITARRWNRLKVIHQQPGPSVHFRPSSPPAQLNRWAQAVDNVYQIYGEGENEYEY